MSVDWKPNLTDMTPSLITDEPCILDSSLDRYIWSMLSSDNYKFVFNVKRTQNCYLSG